MAFTGDYYTSGDPGNGYSSSDSGNNVTGDYYISGAPGNGYSSSDYQPSGNNSPASAIPPPTTSYSGDIAGYAGNYYCSGYNQDPGIGGHHLRRAPTNN